jgi:hypothetical protein
VYRIHLVQDEVQWQAVVITVIYFRVLQRAGNFLTSSATISFSRRMLLHVVGLPLQHR